MIWHISCSVAMLSRPNPPKVVWSVRVSVHRYNYVVTSLSLCSLVDESGDHKVTSTKYFFPVERVKWNDYNKTFNYIIFAVGNIPEPT